MPWCVSNLCWKATYCTVIRLLDFFSVFCFCLISICTKSCFQINAPSPSERNSRYMVEGYDTYFYDEENKALVRTLHWLSKALLYIGCRQSSMFYSRWITQSVLQVTKMAHQMSRRFSFAASFLTMYFECLTKSHWKLSALERPMNVKQPKFVMYCIVVRT